MAKTIFLQTPQGDLTSAIADDNDSMGSIELAGKQHTIAGKKALNWTCQYALG